MIAVRITNAAVFLNPITVSITALLSSGKAEPASSRALKSARAS
jgi:hypothetical protein